LPSVFHIHFSDCPSVSSILRYKNQCSGNAPEVQNPYSRGGQPYVHHSPFFSNPSSLPMRHTVGYLVTMLFHIVSDFPGNDVKCNQNIW